MSEPCPSASPRQSLQRRAVSQAAKARAKAFSRYLGGGILSMGLVLGAAALFKRDVLASEYRIILPIDGSHPSVVSSP
ncbi:hypothetical protein ACCAA_670011 [Candidatus Accumulibacter aalborgensis]|uniref:Uncharacterized protein n=1 Tax=Candidatus Accumulibacter aalborgensis TaxID=1860102 RepID=A0A1A8XWI1_9PROT|nr:hypothetical protein [Candidatus Accumulibacter aalborgensis]SBT09071.1 hypothetical protein ACCAA_670011 [Candidatus Accumulibacter aalborgensis]